jgi:uncharacterized protein YacL (UPF0231 family)
VSAFIQACECRVRYEELDQHEYAAQETDQQWYTSFHISICGIG